METIEYKTQDKSQWGIGDWQQEPDKKQWKDEATGYPCLIVRSRIGASCGYVGVPIGHPYFGLDYDKPEIEVHGGLTFADTCQVGNDESRSICHKVDSEDHVWWFGFNCAHGWDLAPGMNAYPQIGALKGFCRQDGAYRNLEYVACEVESLARQHAERAGLALATERLASLRARGPEGETPSKRIGKMGLLEHPHGGVTDVATNYPDTHRPGPTRNGRHSSRRTSEAWAQLGQRTARRFLD
jgi:hypothetical protein